MRGFSAPYLLILQHHIVDSKTCIVAPVVPVVSDGATLLAPRVLVASAAYRAMLLDTHDGFACIPRSRLTTRITQ